MGRAPFKKVTLTRLNALAFGENWQSKRLSSILAGISEHALLRPHIKRGDEITDQPEAIFDKGRAFTCYAPAVQRMLGNLQMGGCIFNGQKCVGIHGSHPLSGSTSIAELRSRKTKRTQKNHTNPACSPKSGSLKTGLIHLISTVGSICFEGFQHAPAWPNMPHHVPSPQYSQLGNLEGQ